MHPQVTAPLELLSTCAPGGGRLSGRQEDSGRSRWAALGLRLVSEPGCRCVGGRPGGGASGGGWRSPRSRLFPACAPSKGSALCPLTSPVPSRRRFHQSPSGQDLRAGEAERRLHAAEADDGEESCARAPGSSRPPLLTGELRGPVGAASRGVPGGCAVLTAPPWPLPLENSQQ